MATTLAMSWKSLALSTFTYKDKRQGAIVFQNYVKFIILILKKYLNL